MMFWRRKKTIVGVLVVIVGYFVFRCRQYTVKFSATVAAAKPVEVWEFVSDFSNAKTLNPTIKDFTIEKDSGNYGHWKYRVYYTEFLSQLPMFTNFAWADFDVKALTRNTYAIYSHHRTCFFTSFTCVHTDSVFTVEPAATPSDTKYTESITYECPFLFSSFCQREVLHQRVTIRDNLQRIFTHRKMPGLSN